MTLETKKSIMEDFFCHLNGSGILEALDAAGFYEAPASKGHHGAYRGALFDHSLQVTYELQDLTNRLGLKWSRPESPYIIGMLHDLCKMDAYIIKEDGSIEWNKDQELDGHGEKSVILAQKYIQLTDEEIMCIRYHMGAFTDQKEWSKYSAAVAKYPNVLYTHTADMIASQIKGV